MGLVDWLRAKVAERNEFVAPHPPPPITVATPFVVTDGWPDEPENWTVRVKRVGDGWALFIAAPHGPQSLAGVDAALRTILARLPDDVDVPFVCRLVPGRPRNIRNMVAVRLGSDLAVLEPLANHLPDDVLRPHRALVVARFWQRLRDDEPAAVEDFRALLAADDPACDALWLKLSPVGRAATTPALLPWLETRVYGPDDLEDDGSDPEEDSRAASHPRALNTNRLYKLPIELWPDRVLRRALAITRHTRSLVFFDHLTFEVLQAETARRAAVG